jgi:hypothetical protein
MATPPDSAHIGEPGLPLAAALDLLAYLVTAADLCTREPFHYGMFRLIDAASRLAGGLEASGAAANRTWIAGLREQIDAKKELLMWDRAGFESFLHETAADLAGELAREHESRLA